MKYQNRAIIGGLIGNLVEAYDLSLCYYLASTLSHELIGQSKNDNSIILLLACLSYLTKPIGAIILGVLSDAFGRKLVLMVSIIIVGLCTFLIGVIPGYASIGWGAAVLFLLLRIIQTMAMGSEFFNSAALMIESGDETKKGFRGCWSSAGVKAGYLVSCIIVELVAHLYAENSNAWRIPFFLAIATTGIGFFIRAKMPESLEYIRYYANHNKPNTKTIYKQSLRAIKSSPFLFYFAFFTSFLSVATGFFFYLYIPMHAIKYSELTRSAIMTSNIFSLCLVTILIPIFGWFSDKRCRITTLFWASLALFILGYPFMYAVCYGSLPYFVLMQALISIACAAYYSVATVLLTEFFPVHIRCTTLSLVFSVSASLGSGLPPMVGNYLAHVTQNPTTPVAIMLLLSGIVMLNCRLLKQRQSPMHPLEHAA